ncbi:PilW family protein [Pelomonas sp. KK5]|uniref:PilW family protein n=1 Tax=Pelomonas sp. KK5 TaxID=1855730 RepID=UPI001301E287|nr:PilW family protein [Pelomonas sp. KK5]
MMRTHTNPAPGQAGFTLIELLVGMTVGLLVTIAIAAVLVNAENQRRTTSSGSDAQINGGLAIYTIERQLKMAGYGIVTDSWTAGCTLSVQSGGAAIAGAPPVLAPVIITAGNASTADAVRILSSSKTNFVMAAPLMAPFYDPNQSSSNQNTTFNVKSTLGIAKGDLLALVYGSPDTTCEVFQASDVDPPATPSTTTVVMRNDNSWNANKYPTKATAAGAYLVNLGTLNDISFSLTADMRLRQTSYSVSTQAATTQDVQSNIVMLKALYGKDTDGDNIIDTYDSVTPASNADWLKVRAVRLAVVARSAEYEKDEVTTSNPQWDVGSVGTITGASACGTSNCIALHVDGAADWKHYRYKVFDVLVPLRNQLWKS